MIYSVHQPQYIPWLGFFDKIAKSDCFVFLDCVQYKHREFQNRNRIRTKDGWMWLTVPVQYEAKDIVSQVRIDNSRDWKSSHLKSLRSCYGKAEFFDTYFPFFEDIYSRQWVKLIDLNLCIIDYLLKNLGIRTKIRLESKLDIKGERTERIIDIGKSLKADIYLSGKGGRDYLDEGRFKQTGIKLVYQDFINPFYKQQYVKDKKDFIQYLSVIDLLFNEGGLSLEILTGKDSEKVV